MKEEEFAYLQSRPPYERLQAAAELTPIVSAANLPMFQGFKELLFALNARKIRFPVLAARLQRECKKCA